MRSPAHLLGAKRLLCLSCAPLADNLPEAISHLINFVSLSGNPHEALAALQQSLPPTIFQILVQTMARLGEEVGLQMVACGRLSPAVAVKDAVQYCSCGGGGRGRGRATNLARLSSVDSVQILQCMHDVRVCACVCV